MFRKSVLLELGGFDPEFMSGGDYHLCWETRRKGYKLFFNPDAVVKHIHRSTVSGLIKQFFKYGIEQPKLLKKQPGRYSFLKLKTYLFRPLEVRCVLPVQMLFSFDVCSLFLISLLITPFSRVFLFPSLFLFLFVLAGTLREALSIVKRSGSKHWLFLFPCFHLIRKRFSDPEQSVSLSAT